MFIRRMVIATGAAGLALGSLMVLAACVRVDPPRLPALADYANLPPAFAEALRAAHGAVASAAAPAPEAVRRLARLYHANRLWREAKACYEVLAAGSDGLTARDRYYLADIARHENDLAATQAELRAVLAVEPGYLPANLLLADACYKSGDEAGAETTWTAVLPIEADQPDAMVGLARLDLQRGNEDAAVARLEKLMSRHPDAVAGAALLAKILERRGEGDRAIALVQLSQQKPGLPPADPWLEALLADCYDVQQLSITFEEYFKQGRMPAAVPLLDRLAVLDPDGPITKMFAGVSHAKALEHVTAVREYYAALGQGGDPEKVCPLLAQSLLAIGNVEEAAKVIGGYYQKSPDSIPLAKAFADVALRQGEVARARTLLERVLEKEPYLPAQNLTLARIYWTAGERDAAARCLGRVVQAQPQDIPPRALLGEYYLGKSDPYAAIKVLQPALTAAPAGTPVQAELKSLLGTAFLLAGNQEAEKGRLAEAVEFASQASELSPRDLTPLALKADAALRLKRFRTAADALERMAALQPGNPTIHLSWGDVLYQGGEVTQANRQWRQALQLVAPADHDLRAALRTRLEGQITPETFP